MLKNTLTVPLITLLTNSKENTVEKQPISCLYHPTTVVFVDDSSHFLKNITFQLDPHIPYKTFQKPKEALQNLKQSKSLDASFLKFIQKDSSNDLPASGKCSINYEFSTLYEEIYNANRFQNISVVVIDYAMPTMNGIELCRELQNTPIKKILLTGEADYKEAIKAFNEGIIDKFIDKSQKDAGEIVNEAIFELQKVYFKEQSDRLSDALNTDQSFCFQDPLYHSLFNSVFNKINPCDAYLLESSGSFLFMSADGTPTWLIVKSREDLQEYSSVAREYEAPTQVIKSLNERNKIAYFKNFADYGDAMDGNWEKYLHPAANWQGRDKYFYAVVKALPYFGLENHKITSLQDYLKRTN